MSIVSLVFATLTGLVLLAVGYHLGCQLGLAVRWLFRRYYYLPRGWHPHDRNEYCWVWEGEGSRRTGDDDYSIRPYRTTVTPQMPGGWWALGVILAPLAVGTTLFVAAALGALVLGVLGVL